MTNDLRIEHYLLQLDRALNQLSVSQRAEIITEIKSHIHGVMEKDSSRSVESILADLGTPGQVSERYLAAKGIVKTPPSRPRRVLKWLAIATAACFAFLFVSLAAALWYLSPIVHVDEAKGRVILLGGLIDVNEAIGKVKVGGIEVNSALKEGVHVSGHHDLSGGGINLIRIPFNTAKLKLRTIPGQILKWDCKAAGNTSPKAEVDAGVMTLNLDALNLAKCTISLPEGTATEIQGVNGDMQVDEPGDALDISMTNGKVNIKPDSSRIYDFEVKVKNGVQDDFPRSSQKTAVKIKVNLINGLVKKE